MNKIILISLLVLTFAASSFAEVIRATGEVKKIDATDGVKAFYVTIKCSDGKEVVVKVVDEYYVKKIKVREIAVGDEIRMRYDNETNIAPYIRKTAGM